MQKEFKLEVILSVLTGISFVDDFNEVFELAHYIFSDPYINDSALRMLNNTMREHILIIHPELENLSKIYVPESEIVRNLWMKNQKSIFGDHLFISKIYQGLDEIKLIKSMK